MDNPAGAIRYAIRQFRLSPVFTASAVLTLSLGIGGTTAIFTLIHAVMLRSLPVADPERLYRIGDGDNCCVQGGPQELDKTQIMLLVSPGFDRSATVGFRCVSDVDAQNYKSRK